jgi:hypothetical protein
MKVTMKEIMNQKLLPKASALELIGFLAFTPMEVHLILKKARTMIMRNQTWTPVIIHAELAQDFDCLLDENTSLKARLEQLELERQQMLVLSMPPLQLA